MANRMVLDTETTSLDRPFCYDIGWLIFNSDNGEVLSEKHYVIEQVWHNLPLFESAYYKEKRPDYVTLMRQHSAIMDKFGYVMQAMRREILKYEVVAAYAFNSNFDDKVLAFNCDWFKCMNPLDDIPVFDIWGYSSAYITNTPDFRTFCEANQRFTDTGNYSGNAETVYQFITNNPAFVERHMGYYDSDIEMKILLECVKRGAAWDTPYPAKRVLPRIQNKPFTIKVNGTIIYQGEYIKKNVRNDIYNFTTGE